MPKRQGRELKSKMWTIISDPSGDFRKDARFGVVEMSYMEKDYRLPVGMVMELNHVRHIVNKYGKVVEMQ